VFRVLYAASLWSRGFFDAGALRCPYARAGCPSATGAGCPRIGEAIRTVNVEWGLLLLSLILWCCLSQTGGLSANPYLLLAENRAAAAQRVFELVWLNPLWESARLRTARAGMLAACRSSTYVPSGQPWGSLEALWRCR